MTVRSPARDTVPLIGTTITIPSLDELTGGHHGVLVVGAALVALAVVLARGSWRIARSVVTIAHEGGHALVALLAGRTLTKILLHSDTSGVTVSRGRPDGPGMAATTFAGYVTPPLLGLGAAVLVAADAIEAMLGLAIVLLLATLILIRNVFGVVSVVGTGAVVALVIAYGSPDVQYVFACFLTWLLILGGLRTIVEVQRKRLRRRSPDSDADQLERLTSIPARIWVAMFGLVAAGALIGAGRLLVGWPPG